MTSLLTIFNISGKKKLRHRDTDVSNCL